jgi:signal transduction histidine kinase
VEKAFGTGQFNTLIRTAFDAEGKTSYWENACFPILDSEGNIVAGAEVCRNISDRVTLEAEVKDRNIELGQLAVELKRRMADIESELHAREAAERELRQEMEERQRVELELRQAQKLQAVGQLAAGIAHEINTPVQYVGDNIRFLADSFGSLRELLAKYQQSLAALVAASGHDSLARELRQAEETADIEFVKESAPLAFDGALEGISRISRLVGAMKEFAHPDRRDKSAADLNRALNATLTLAANEYKYVAEVETDLAEIPPVMCHLGELNQVFLNLIVNAAHAIADAVGSSGGGKGCIRVRTAHEDGRVRIEIADTGCGIPEGIRERVFDPFFTTKPVGQGSGQGLAIARSIVVDKHGGTLTFESEVDRGTKFTILLPVGQGAIVALEDSAM